MFSFETANQLGMCFFGILVFHVVKHKLPSGGGILAAFFQCPFVAIVVSISTSPDSSSWIKLLAVEMMLGGDWNSHNGG